ncbi:hypothetical protein [Thermoactinomyces sp. DSM 45892]|uniref:DUF7003 family protein n=1 Tax=Thermoactinomyces sp. DSM 45892 TaxID=1882753 RepID=UPI00089D8866|nr:hypothetical protein [Thermoactinomyces sp. DSM 45892]SDY31127.1 hypothetical protein SAMN05444416_103241 [Thermoactinomyces sp. DSM 45892]
MSLILEQFDLAAEKFEFPVLDNYNVDLAQTRLLVFKDDHDWLVTFEVVGYFISGQTFTNDLYVFGNQIEKFGLSECYENVISECGSEKPFPFIDSNGNFELEPLSSVCFKIWREEIRLSPTVGMYREAGIDLADFSPTKFLRLISYLHSEKLWLKEEFIFNKLSLEPMELFYKTSEWHHNDVLVKPSEHEFFRQLSKAIEYGNVGLIPTGNVNTHWSNWATSSEE